MFRRVREVGPALWVPLAWGFVAAAHLELVGDWLVYVALVVMLAMLVGFLALSWDEMASGALRAWRYVILVGIPVTAAGIAGLFTYPHETDLLVVSLLGWMLLPAPAFWDTAARSAAAGEEQGALVNRVAAGLTVFGAAAYAVGLLVGGLDSPTTSAALLGLAGVGLGQTVGIVDAVVRY
jgi:hypothetical protein